MKKVIPFILPLLTLTSCANTGTVYGGPDVFETEEAIISLNDCSLSQSTAVFNFTVTRKTEQIERLDFVYAINSEQDSIQPDLVEYNGSPLTIHESSSGYKEYWLYYAIVDDVFSLHVQYDLSNHPDLSDDLSFKVVLGGTKESTKIQVAYTYRFL